MQFVQLAVVLFAIQAASLYAQTSYNVRTLVGDSVTSYVPKLPYGIAVESSGNIVFSDKAQVMRFDPRTGSVTVVAGTGEEGYSGDGGPATSAKLRSAYDLAIDGEGNIYVADSQDQRIRRIDINSGLISTLAGTGEAGFSGDGGAATSAKLRFPRGLGYDPAGALLIADTENYRLRRVDLQTGGITTLVGGGTQSTGATSQVSLCWPLDAIVAGNGDVFIAEGSCGGVMRFSPSDGQVTVYVNESRRSSQLDGIPAAVNIPARDFRFQTPYALEFDADGHLLVADHRFGGVFRVDRDTTIVSRVAGTGYYNETDDVTAAVNRRVVSSGIVRAPSGVLYLSGYLRTGETKIEQLTPLNPGDPTQVLVNVFGAGSVLPTPMGVSCGANCWQYPFGTTVSLTALPTTPARFVNWSGGCSGSQLSCVVTPGSTAPVNAFFGSPTDIKLEAVGTGSGTIRTNPATVECRSSCVIGFFNGTPVQFIADPAPGSRFVGWEGECAGVTDATCNRTINQSFPPRDIVARARFELISVKLRIEFFGTGTGTVVVNSRGMRLASCTATCVIDVNGGDLLTLGADAGNPFVENASAFSGWRSCTIGTDPVYDVFRPITAGVTSCVGVGFYVSRITNIDRISFAGLTAADSSFIREAYGPLWSSTNGGLMVGGKSSNGPYIFTPLRTPGPGYRVLRHLDLNRDVWNDVIFQKVDQTDGFGPVSAWLTYQSTQLTPMRNVRLNWQVQASGDLDGDGFGDLVWRYLEPGSNDTGVSYIWFMRNGQVEQVRKRGGAPLDWTLLGALDINRDGADELFYVSPTGDIRVLMATPARTCANVSGGRVPNGFVPLAVGRFTQSGVGGEVLIRNPTTGELSLLKMSGFGVDLPGAAANPDDPNAACTSTSTVLSSSLQVLPASGRDWIYLGKDKASFGQGPDVILFMRPDRQIMRLENLESAFSSQPARFVEAGQVPAGYRMVNR